jgi:hypothetical protein
VTVHPAPVTTARLVARSSLSAAELGAMRRLLDAHFEGVTAEQFTADLAEKNWAVLIERGGRLVGFTTILAYEAAVDGATLSVVYSGDTIVAPEAWGSATLPRAWIESVIALRRQHPRGRYLWLLITSGFRTYRFLPVFWREFYPRHDASTPPDWRRLTEALATDRFGNRYDPRAGVVRLAGPQRLRGALAGVPAGRADDPHVAFFSAANPGHAAGDELVCLTELAPANLTAAGRRMTAGLAPW